MLGSQRLVAKRQSSNKGLFVDSHDSWEQCMPSNFHLNLESISSGGGMLTIYPAWRCALSFAQIGHLVFSKVAVCQKPAESAVGREWPGPARFRAAVSSVRFEELWAAAERLTTKLPPSCHVAKLPSCQVGRGPL